MHDPEPPDAAPVRRRAITRPPINRPGGPAPWADLPEALRRPISLDRVRTVLGDDLRALGGRSRTSWPTQAGQVVEGRPAAVLVPLFEEEGECRVVLTVRSDRLRSHQGEVAFPGGRLEPGEDPVTGALREATEEVSLDASLVTVIGQLTAMPTVSSNTFMTPVVGALARRPAVKASPAEVERVFDVALADLVTGHAFHEEWWSVPDRLGADGLPVGEFPVWFFEVAGETVWGATARTLMELLCLILGVAFPRPFRAGTAEG
jgi:8-oxo-dGTP pyrophosphatase MutT (NUDIX family)